MNGTANVNPAGRSHYASAIPVPRAVAHSKLHAVAPPSTLGPPAPHGATSPRPGKALAPSPKTLKPKDAGRATGNELAKGREGSHGVPFRGGQKALARPLVSPGKWPEAAGSRRIGAGRVGEPNELPKAPPTRSRGGVRPGASLGKGSGVATAGMGDESHGGLQGRGSLFGSGAITFSSGPPHSHPITATVAPFQYRLQEDQVEEKATSPGDKCSGPEEGPEPDPKPKTGGLSESGGVCWGRLAGGLLGWCWGAEDHAGAQTPMAPCQNRSSGWGSVGWRWGTPTQEVPQLPWEWHGYSCRIC
ncbi:uncharacterized protein ENSP00000471857-like [Tyto alba]|uniref:uncharacterized protein ENSP00000471857-like n=1 Tax=Tyto alba TaxID=56313 RepID=UPI001403E856|nr:uncharacterized protein ENSP00000471857-like [Tyto alba]